ncbi:MAG: response regulator [Polyangiaceae bacterium]|nr:response regulator [Polyangiaceae bacterium]
MQRGSAVSDVMPRRRVLIIDDEALVASALRRCLLRDHDVTVSTEPVDALAELRAGARYDIVLCDLMMPTLGGLALHAELAVFAPEQAERVVFMTGGIQTAEVRELLGRTRNRCISKPCTVQEVRRAVEAMPPWSTPA